MEELLTANLDNSQKRHEYKLRTNDYLKTECMKNKKTIYTILENIPEVIPSPSDQSETQNNLDKEMIDAALMGGIEWKDTEYTPTLENLKAIEEIYEGPHSIRWVRLKNIYPNSIGLTEYEPIVRSLRLRFPPNPLEPYTPPLEVPSALSCLSSQPSLLLRIMPWKSPNKSGVYSVWLFLKNGWTSVKIDDYVPVFVTGKGHIVKDLCMNMEGSSIYYKLLEKALAKVCGGYENIGEVMVEDLLRTLTGGTITIVSLPRQLAAKDLIEVQRIWSKMGSALVKGFVISVEPRAKNPADSEAKEAARKSSQSGLALNHNYSVLKIARIQVNPNEPGEDTYLLLLRTPYVEEQWLGDWGRNSPRWTPPVQNLLDYNPQNCNPCDFWIPYKDFLNFFGKVIICKVRTDSTYQSLPLQCEQKGVARLAFRLSVTQYSKFSITLAHSPVEEAFGDIKITLGKLHQGRYRFLGYSNSEAQNCCSLTSKTLISGEYFILVEIKRKKAGQPIGDVCLTVSGPGPFGVKNIENSNDSAVHDFLCHKVWSYYAEKVEGEKIDFLQLRQTTAPTGLSLQRLDVPGASVYSLENQDECGVELRVHIVPQNKTRKKEVRITTLNMNDRVSIEVDKNTLKRDFEVLGPGAEISKSHKFRLDPGERKVFVVRHLRDHVDKNDEELGFLFNCSEIEFYRNEVSALGRVLEEKNKIAEQDGDIYKALAGDTAPYQASNLDRRAVYGEIFEKAVRISPNEYQAYQPIYVKNQNFFNFH